MERLQKYMARAGIASRRNSEKIILEGRVAVNGEITRELGIKIDSERDMVTVDGVLIKEEEKKIYLMLNKPKGYLTSLYDPRGRPLITELIKDIEERVYPVGRLDFNTKGLLLLTNDGDFANLLTHPAGEVPKTYRALVKGLPSVGKIKQLEKGVKLNDGLTAPAKADLVRKRKNNGVLEITIHEGRNRQVRRMCEEIGYPVLDLERVKIAGIGLGDLKRGEYRHLTSEEIKSLKKSAGYSKKDFKDKGRKKY